MTSNITGLAHIGIFAKDIDVSINFYKGLGFALDTEETAPDGTRLAFLSAGTCLIELIGKSEERTHGAVDHIAMVVDDIIQAVATAKEKGIDINAMNISKVNILGGVKNVFFEGPDGERLEFFEYC